MRILLAALAALLLAGCARSPKPAVQALDGTEDCSRYALTAMRGTRDGDKLAVQARFSDGAGTLTVEMRFAVGSPTKLESGSWVWLRGEAAASGSAAERSVTFLGGQSGPPSLGGTFDLLASEGGQPRYRVTIPNTELKIPWKPAI